MRRLSSEVVVVVVVGAVGFGGRGAGVVGEGGGTVGAVVVGEGFVIVGIAVGESGIAVGLLFDEGVGGVVVPSPMTTISAQFQNCSATPPMARG